MNRLNRMTGLVPVIIGLFCACQGTAKQVDMETDLKAMYADLPFSMPTIERPVFPDYQVNICDFGAKSDGVTLNTEAINNAIKVVHDKGGGKVVIPEGLWLTGPIVLQSNVNLHAEKNALIVFSSDTSLYPIITTSFEGLDAKRCQSPISAMNAENIAITGYGVFDGAGDRWRPVKKDKMTDRQWKNLVNSADNGVLMSCVSDRISVFFSFCSASSFSLLLSNVSRSISIPHRNRPKNLLFSALTGTERLPFARSSVSNCICSNGFMIFFPI